MRAPDPPAAAVWVGDAVLLDTGPAWSRAGAVLYRRYGAEFTLEHKRELIGTAGAVASAIVERHLGRPGEGAALRDELNEIVFTEVGRSAPPQPGAVELVRALRAAGVALGVASTS